MPLDVRQRSFKAEEITYLDRKSIQLDRMLLNLFELLRFDGRPAVRRRRRSIDVPALVDLIRQNPDRFPGFDDRPDVAEAWLTADLLEIMNRGKPGREMVVGPRPFHLNSFKLTNPKAAADYGASTQVWAMLFYADRPLLSRLKEFFGRGLDPALDRYDRSTELDLETLAVLGLVDQVTVNHVTQPAPDPLRPLCEGQGRIMADDLRRLLAYEGAVPRHVLANYVRTVLGLHLALFILRLFKLVPNRVARAKARDTAFSCPVDEGTCLDVTMCPYQDEIILDLTEDQGSPTAALARESAARYLDGISEYVRAVIMLNRVKDFAEVQARAGRRPPAKSVSDLLEIVANPPETMDGFFEARIADATATAPDEAEDPMARAILQVPGLSALERYVEIVCLYRMRNERSRLMTLVDSLTQKNRPGGFLKQTASARSPRWFVMGSHLLETLVQIAVVERASSGQLSARSILVDDFRDWLRSRYGFVVYAPSHRQVPAEVQDAWRRNDQALRERLHQIGFYTDLSDAYNSQTLRPRYQVIGHA